jgi:molecular chaperone GrpE
LTESTQSQDDQHNDTDDAEDTTSLEDDFEELQDEYEQLQNQLKRTHADFQNYKKRVHRRKEQRQQQAVRSLVEDLLPYLDNQDLTLQEADDYESLRESVELNHDQLLNVLNDHGLTVIDTNGQFDPQRHEATLTKQTNDESKHNHVVDELRKGYKLGDTVIRHAQVSIAQYQDNDNTNDQHNESSKEEHNE